MKYLIMECHPKYAVVLDNQGRFLKVSNPGYEVGQVTNRVLELEEPKKFYFNFHWNKQLSMAAFTVASLFLFFFSSWHFLFSPFGTVRMQINPDVMMSVNRINYVIELDGVNADGERLVEGMHTFGKKVSQLSDEIAQRAVKMGYLQDGGQITLTVESSNQEWKTATEELLLLDLEVHLQNNVTIILGPIQSESPEMENQTLPDPIIIPVIPGDDPNDDSDESTTDNGDDGEEDDSQDDLDDDDMDESDISDDNDEIDDTSGSDDDDNSDENGDSDNNDDDPYENDGDDDNGDELDNDDN